MSVENYILGSILPNNAFTLMTFLPFQSSKIPAYLTFYTGSQGPVLLFDPTYQTAPSGSTDNLVSITATSSGSAFTMSTTQGDLVADSENMVQISKNPGSVLLPVNSNYNTWGVFLTGIPYLVNGPNNQPIQWQAPTITQATLPYAGPTQVTVDYTNLTSLTGPLYALPSIYYRRGSCTTGYNTLDAIVQYDQAWNQQATGDQFYTDAVDCANNLWYTYCSTNVSCSNVCKGPCSGSLSADQCLVNQAGTGFVCSKPPNNKSWWQTPIIWLALLILIITIIIVVLVLWGIMRRKGSPKK